MKKRTLQMWQTRCWFRGEERLACSSFSLPNAHNPTTDAVRLLPIWGWYDCADNTYHSRPDLAKTRAEVRMLLEGWGHTVTPETTWDYTTQADSHAGRSESMDHTTRSRVVVVNPQHPLVCVGCGSPSTRMLTSSGGPACPACYDALSE